MELIIIYIAALIGSLLLVIKTADIFVDNLVDIGEAKGISQIILGVTASAIGTSLPEFGSAMIAVLSGSPDIGVGVVIGSNIWNIAGILGISAFIAGFIKTGKEELKRDGLMTLLTAVILTSFMLFLDKITAVVGIVLISAYVVYLWFLIKKQKENSPKNKEIKKEIKTNSEGLEEIRPDPTNYNFKKNILMTALGISGLVIGCRIMIWSGVEIAQTMNIPQMIVGLFALGIGTSAPELVVTLSSAMKRLYGLSIGTVLGSNVFNILIGLGVPSLFLAIPVEPLSVTFDAPVMILVTSFLLLLTVKNMKLTRWGGLVLMSIYIAYITIRIYISV